MGSLLVLVHVPLVVGISEGLVHLVLRVVHFEAGHVRVVLLLTVAAVLKQLSFALDSARLQR